MPIAAVVVVVVFCCCSSRETAKWQLKYKKLARLNRRQSMAKPLEEKGERRADSHVEGRAMVVLERKQEAYGSCATF